MRTVITRRLAPALCALLGSTLVAHAPPPAPMPQSPGRPTSASLEPGVLPRAWNTSGPKCMEMPAFQVHEYNPNFFILRQSGCIHYEKPFLYLIFGRDKALLEDTGAGTDRYRVGRDGSRRDVGEAEQQDHARAADRRPLAFARRSHRRRRRVQEPAERAARASQRRRAAEGVRHQDVADRHRADRSRRADRRSDPDSWSRRRGDCALRPADRHPADRRQLLSGPAVRRR